MQEFMTGQVSKISLQFFSPLKTPPSQWSQGIKTSSDTQTCERRMLGLPIPSSFFIFSSLKVFNCLHRDGQKHAHWNAVHRHPYLMKRKLLCTHRLHGLQYGLWHSFYLISWSIPFVITGSLQSVRWCSLFWADNYVMYVKRKIVTWAFNKINTEENKEPL